MKAEDILRLKNLGEETSVQFKERIIDKYDAGCELVAKGKRAKRIASTTSAAH